MKRAVIPDKRSAIRNPFSPAAFGFPPASQHGCRIGVRHDESGKPSFRHLSRHSGQAQRDPESIFSGCLWPFNMDSGSSPG